MSIPAYAAVPPAVFFCCVGLAAMIDTVYPGARIIHPPFTFAGYVIMAFSAIQGFGSLARFLRKGTTVFSGGRPSRLVTSGWFSLTRNPMYLALVVCLAGFCVTLGALAPFLAPACAWFVYDSLVIPKEERKLEEVFGAEYREYKTKVRRWIGRYRRA